MNINQLGFQMWYTITEEITVFCYKLSRQQYDTFIAGDKHHFPDLFMAFSGRTWPVGVNRRGLL